MSWYHRQIKIFLAGFILSSATFADGDANYLQQKLQYIKTMQASFSQSIEAKKVNTSRSYGSMALSKPNLFRWQTDKPMSQLFIADGKKMWMYDKDLEQVSVREQGVKLGGIAGVFFGNESGVIERDFKVKLLKKNNVEYFELRSKRKTNFSKVNLMFSGPSLRQIELYDELGQKTRVELHHVVINSNLPAQSFKFIVPKGTDVVRQ